ncbi:MAG: polysaccharide deacetylase family protein [Chitinophagaceae bacterium]
MAGIFTISLDFELHWGVFDKRSREQRITNYKNTVKLVPQMLALFEQYGVQVTWATVGSLYCANKQAWEAVSPSKDLQPASHLRKYSAYHYVHEHNITLETSIAHFAPDIVQQIPQYEGQELGTHTFAHYYCVEPGQTVAQFDADLKAHIAASDALGMPRPTSLVFPRNQYNEAYLQCCIQNGITAIRSNPNVWYWSGVSDANTSLLRKLVRTGDVYFPVGKQSWYSLDSLTANAKAAGIVSIPASRLLRQYDAKRTWINGIRLKRLLHEMHAAAKANACYHLWWHPENFGDHPEACMQELQLIVQHYQQLQRSYGMQSWNMQAIAKQLLAN